jgi:hypothetical protein
MITIICCVLCLTVWFGFGRIAAPYIAKKAVRSDKNLRKLEAAKDREKDFVYMVKKYGADKRYAGVGKGARN